MKRLVCTMMMSILLLGSAYAQKDSTKISLGNIQIIITEKEGGDEVKVRVDEEEVINVKENHSDEQIDVIKEFVDSSREAKTEKDIEENLEQKMENFEKKLEIAFDCEEEENEKGFKKSEYAHWTGFGIGVNGFLTPDYETNLNDVAPYVDLDLSKSITFNINFFETNVTLFKNRLSLTTGMGIQQNRYSLRNNVNLQYNSDSLWGQLDTVRQYTKNLLKAAYIQIPLLLEINTGDDPKKNFHVSAGVVGGFKIASKLKQKSEIGDSKRKKTKTKGTYNLNPFQLYLTGRVGFSDITLFANYGLLSAFEQRRGPEVSPFTIGLQWAVFD